MTVDPKAASFRVIYTDFKNASKDVVIEATTVETYYPDGRIVITEEDYTQIIYNDENETTESFLYRWNVKMTIWSDTECQY